MATEKILQPHNSVPSKKKKETLVMTVDNTQWPGTKKSGRNCEKHRGHNQPTGSGLLCGGGTRTARGKGWYADAGRGLIKGTTKRNQYVKETPSRSRGEREGARTQKCRSKTAETERGLTAHLLTITGGTRRSGFKKGQEKKRKQHVNQRWGCSPTGGKEKLLTHKAESGNGGESHRGTSLVELRNERGKNATKTLCPQT